MSSSNRYYNRKKRTNNSRLYRDMLADRGLHKGVVQYTTPTLRYPTVEEIEELTLQTHVWGYGDKFYKIAHKYYGNSELWWIIAWYNKFPTEAHVPPGATLYIPFPLESVYLFFGV